MLDLTYMWVFRESLLCLTWLMCMCLVNLYYVWPDLCRFSTVPDLIYLQVFLQILYCAWPDSCVCLENLYWPDLCRFFNVPDLTNVYMLHVVFFFSLCCALPDLCVCAWRIFTVSDLICMCVCLENLYCAWPDLCRFFTVPDLTNVYMLVFL